MEKENKELTILLIAESISNLGDGIWIILLPLLGYNIWHDTLAIGITSIVMLVPYVLGVAFSNKIIHIVPTFLMIICDVGRLITTILLVIFMYLNMINFTLFIILVLIFSSFSVFYIPSRVAAIPMYFSESLVEKSEAIFNISDFLFLVLGKLICGVLLGLAFSYEILIIINGITFIISMICNMYFHNKYRAKVSFNDTENKTSMAEIKNAFTRKDIRIIVIAFVILNLAIGGILENLIPTLLIVDKVKDYKFIFSILNSAFDIGMLMSNMVFLKYPIKRLNNALLAIPIIVTLGIVIFLSVPLIFKVAVIFMIGFLAALLDVTTVVYMQMTISAKLLTGVFTIVGSISKTVEPISSVIYLFLCQMKNINLAVFCYNIMLGILMIVILVNRKKSGNYIK